MSQKHAETAVDEWVTFPGGELEGKRPKALCAACREALNRTALQGGRSGAPSPRVGRGAARRPLCFQCYRADLERDRALEAAGELNTTSAERFQYQLPLEPVDRARLERLKAERQAVRSGTPIYETRRRHAQIRARHALQQIAAGLRQRGFAAADRDRAVFEAIHAAELQLPDAWLPFVVAR